MAKGKLTPPPPADDPNNRSLPEDPEIENPVTEEENSEDEEGD